MVTSHEGDIKAILLDTALGHPIGQRHTIRHTTSDLGEIRAILFDTPFDTPTGPSLALL